MKIVHIPACHGFDSDKQIFVDIEETTLKLEHSLISLKKWEQKWKIAFLDKNTQKTTEMWIDYIRCMTINTVDDRIYQYMSLPVIKDIIKYIEDPMTATWFSNKDTIGAAKNKDEIVTAEVIYYWMIALNIPVEFEKWHLNQLLTLIRVVNIKNNPKKMNAKDAAAQRRSLNAARRAKHHSRG